MSKYAKFKVNQEHFNPKNPVDKVKLRRGKIPLFFALLLLVGIIVFGSGIFAYLQSLDNHKRQTFREEKQTFSTLETEKSDSSASESSQSSSSSSEVILVDNASMKINQYIKDNAKKYPNYIRFMGNIYLEDLESLNIKPPITLSSEDKQLRPLEEGEEKPAQRIKDLIPKPSTLESTEVEPVTKLEKRNLLVFPAYKIEVPIIFLTFDDLFPRDSNGNINVAGDLSYPLDRPICQTPFYRDVCSPVQKKLEKGVVHVPFSVQPGEVGNSYIAGHTSNYNFINSPYNTVFKPMEKKTKPGEIFYIYDKDGRKLTFKVFEGLLISEEDVEEAYRYYPDRRVVTLQGSVLTYDTGVGMPTHRWLTRGELVLDASS